MEAVRDDRAIVESALDHDGHLVPGLVHLATVDALDRQHVEDDRVPVDRDFLGGDAQHGDLAAVAHVVEHVAKGAGLPDISRPTSKPSVMPSCFCTSAMLSRANIHDACGPHLLGQFQSLGIHVGDDDVAGPGMLRDRGGHACRSARPR